ncbi:hypothetical protein E2562_029062 [Oryza meyeriana var. granulata]|uniref:Uncharacterized protein n=1 Tax=Oryza meyeriana var. granulata TaxID=110450 RepID=A0A6G1CUC8_9ORYZ|nr:hypothetical protein E2562_029062 [Oryza meyeriana var. granulata]
MRGRVAAAQSVHECSAETRTSAPSCCSRHDARRKAAVTGGALVAEPLSRIMHAQQRPRGRSPESGPGSSSARELDVAVAGVGWSGGFAPATSPPRVVPREVVRPSTAAAAVLSRPRLGPNRQRPAWGQALVQKVQELVLARAPSPEKRDPCHIVGIRCSNIDAVRGDTRREAPFRGWASATEGTSLIFAGLGEPTPSRA